MSKVNVQLVAPTQWQLNDLEALERRESNAIEAAGQLRLRLMQGLMTGGSDGKQWTWTVQEMNAQISQLQEEARHARQQRRELAAAYGLKGI